MSNEIIFEAKTKGLLKGGAALRVYADRLEVDDSEAGGVGSLLSLVGKKRAGVFPFEDCLGLEKDGSAIRIILSDGTAKDYAVDKSEAEAAFSFAAQAFKPYKEALEARQQTDGVKFAAVSGDGLVATAYEDRLELVKKGKADIYVYEEIRLARISTMRRKFELYLADGSKRTESIIDSQRAGLLAAVKEKIAPFNAERRKKQGVEFALECEEDGYAFIYGDRVEFVDFGENRKAAFPLAALKNAELSGGKLKFTLKYEKSLSFAIMPLDEGTRAGLLAFCKAAINRPGRLAFGIDEIIQVEEDKGTLRIFQANGKEVSGKIALLDVLEFATAEGLFQTDVAKNPLAAGGTTSLKESVDNLKALGKEKAVTFVGVALKYITGDGDVEKTVKFGNFPRGMKESKKEYAQAVAEAEKFVAYMAVHKMKGQ